MIVFQFINYYGSIFYIAFFKGRLVDQVFKLNYYREIVLALWKTRPKFYNGNISGRQQR